MFSTIPRGFVDAPVLVMVLLEIIALESFSKYMADILLVDPQSVILLLVIVTLVKPPVAEASELIACCELLEKVHPSINKLFANAVVPIRIPTAPEVNTLFVMLMLLLLKSSTPYAEVPVVIDKSRSSRLM